MTRTSSSLAAAALLAGALLTHAARPAGATVDAFIPYVVPQHHLQTDDVCLAPQTMWAELGIPPASQAEALLAPVYVYRQGGEHVDVNALSLTGGMTQTYVADSYDEAGVVTYEMILDVTALAARNGGSVAGRQATVEAAKLYLLSMAASLEAIAPGAWRLSLRFTGLPSQTSLAGTRLPARTSWPYSGGSSLLAAFRRELIDVSGSCP